MTLGPQLDGPHNFGRHHQSLSIQEDIQQNLTARNKLYQQLATTFERSKDDHPVVRDMKAKMNNISKRLNTIEMQKNAEADAKSSLFGDFSNEA